MNYTKKDIVLVANFIAERVGTEEAPGIFNQVFTEDELIHLVAAREVIPGVYHIIESE